MSDQKPLSYQMHIQKGCSRKVRHKTRQQAKKHIQAVGDPGLEVYRCPFCRDYHVGHSGWRYLNDGK